MNNAITHLIIINTVLFLIRQRFHQDNMTEPHQHQYTIINPKAKPNTNTSLSLEREAPTAAHTMEHTVPFKPHQTKPIKWSNSNHHDKYV